MTKKYMINSKKIQNYSRGFTLIELMVAMAIVGILAATAMVNFGKNDDRDVRAEKDRLTSFLREVQNKALAGDKADITLVADEKICGYGVYYNSGNLQAFYASVSGLDSNCSTASKSNIDNVEFIPRHGVTITSFDDVFFSSPTGDVFVGGSEPDPVSGFSIGLTKGSSTDIYVNITSGGNIK